MTCKFLQFKFISYCYTQCIVVIMYHVDFKHLYHITKLLYFNVNDIFRPYRWKSTVIIRYFRLSGWKFISICISVVTVSKISPSVGFGKFCKKNRGFRYGFCLSRFPPVVNVVRLSLHIKPAAVCYIFLCITPVDSSKYPTACDWWRENHHLYPMSRALRNATCLAVCTTDIRC